MQTQRCRVQWGECTSSLGLDAHTHPSTNPEMSEHRAFAKIDKGSPGGTEEPRPLLPDPQADLYPQSRQSLRWGRLGPCHYREGPLSWPEENGQGWQLGQRTERLYTLSGPG